MRLVSVFFGSLLALTGCPGDDSGNNDTEANTSDTGMNTSPLEPCTPGEERACDCAGTPGTQACNGAGTAYGPCLCTSPTTTTPMTTTAPPPDDDDDGMDTTDGDTTSNPTTGMATDSGGMMTDSGGMSTTSGTTSAGGSSSGTAG